MAKRPPPLKVRLKIDGGRTPPIGSGNCLLSLCEACCHREQRLSWLGSENGKGVTRRLPSRWQRGGFAKFFQQRFLLKEG